MDKLIRILLLEDSSDDVALIERELLKAGIHFSCRVVNSKASFQEALDAFKPDVVLSDHSLPRFNSIEALEIHRQHQLQENSIIPFILVTGVVSEEFGVQCIKAGADDYILKDRLKRLPASIHNALDKSRIEGERKKYLDKVIADEAMMKEAERLAHFGSWQADLLTGKHQLSDEAFRIFGYEPGEIEMTYETFLSHIYPDDISDVKRQLDEVFTRPQVDTMEIRIVDKNGAIKYLNTKLMVKRDALGKPIQLVGFNLDITEKKKADIKLQESEQEYRSLFAQNPDAVCSLDLNGKFTNVNEEVVKFTGLTAEALLQLDFSRFLAPDDCENVRNKFLAATKGIPQRYEARFVTPRGKRFTLSITNIPIVVDGQIVGVHGIAKDITRRKALEDLVDQVQKLARIGGWEVDLLTNIVRWTSVTKELHEVPSDFVPDLETGITFYEGGPSRETMRQLVKNAVDSGESFDTELQVRTAKGNLRWMRVIGETEIRDGRCVRLFGSVQDIHVRKEAEETLKESYREKTRILESIGDAFFAVDRNWIVTYWNNVAEKKLGMKRDRILGRNLWEVYDDAVRLAFYTQYHTAVRENVSVHFEEYYPPLSLWIEVSAYPSPSGLSVYFRDVTALRKYTKEIEDQNNKLKEIAWIQSHEVRGPLARMMGLINLLTDHDGIETQVSNREILNCITQSAHELDRLIRAIVRKTEDIHQ